MEAVSGEDLSPAAAVKRSLVEDLVDGGKKLRAGKPGRWRRRGHFRLWEDVLHWSR